MFRRVWLAAVSSLYFSFHFHSELILNCILEMCVNDWITCSMRISYNRIINLTNESAVGLALVEHFSADCYWMIDIALWYFVSIQLLSFEVFGMHVWLVL